MSVSDSSLLSKALRQHYLTLPQGKKCQVTYVWIDGSGEGLRNKARTLEEEPKSIKGKTVKHLGGQVIYCTLFLKVMKNNW